MMASLCLALALVSDPLAGRLCGKGPTPPDGYSPPLISNGDLNMLVEWTGGQSGRAYNQMRTTVYWQGRRGPARDAELFAFGRFNPTMVVEGKAVGLPAAWSQTLDVRQALVTCVGAFAEGLEATTEVFCALDRNVVAIRRTVANTSGKPLNLTLDLAYTIEPHSRLVGAWTKQDRYFETSPYVRMRGVWEEPNTDVRRVFHGLTYGQNVIGFDIAVTACDGGLIRRDVALAPGAKTSHAWFVTYSDTYEKTPTAIPQTDWDGLFATHAKLWAGYWAESFVRLPDAKLQRMYDVQQYHLRCNATRWGFPVGIFPFHWQGKYFGFDEMYIHDGLVSSGHFSVARRCPDWRYAVMHRALTRQSHYTKRGKYGARWLLEAAGAMGPFGETWEINEPGLRIHPWFTTASGNCVFAVNEMLVRGTVPETWKDYAFRLPDGKGRWIDCEVKDGRRVRFHRTGISRVGSVAKERGF